MASLKNKTLQGVLFDWDGTLINSYAADSSAYLAMFREMGIPWGLEELAQHYSPNWYRVYRAAKLPRARWDDADRAWRAQYAKHSPRLIAGARQVLDRLGRAHHLGLVTSGDRDRVTQQLREFRLTRAVWSARVQRRYSRKETASRSAAARSATTLSEAVSVRVRGRFARGFGDGQESRSARHRGPRTISDGEASARGAPGFLARIDPGITGSTVDRNC